MTGGTRKRGETWSYYFDMGTVNGKRKKKEKGGFKTKKEAAAALAVAISEYNNAGLVFEPSSISVSDYLDLWYKDYCLMNMKHNSLLGVERVIRVHLKPRFGNYKLKALSTAPIQEFVNDLKKNGYSLRFTKNIFSVLKTALDYAVYTLHYIKDNPCIGVKIPKYPDQKPVDRYVIPPEDFDRIIERFPEGSPYYLPLMIGYYTGLRISEVFALTWDDIDLKERTITVNKQTVKMKSYGEKKAKASVWYFQSPKTEASNRTVYFGDTLYRVLRNARVQKYNNRIGQGTAFIEYYKKPDKDEKGDPIWQLVPVPRLVRMPLESADLVCVRSTGEYVSSDSFKYCARVIHYELMMNFNFHSLRHTHATYLVESGANIKDVQERLGHQNVETTINTYVHDTEQLRKQTVDIFESAIASKRA